MRHSLLMAWLAALAITVPAQAQGPGFSQFRLGGGSSATYDSGLLTLTRATSDSTAYGYQPLQVQLWIRSNFYAGQGVYHDFADDGPQLNITSLVSFTVRSSSGDVLVANGWMDSNEDITRRRGGALPDGILTVYPLAAPTNQVKWFASPVGPTVINTSPTLHSGWSTRTSLEAMGGTYSATANTQTTPDSSATWSGSVPVPGVYEISAWLPISLPGSLPRTARATYGTGIGALVAQAPISQSITTSGWVVIGTASISDSYHVVLSDQTGEPAGTRSVVANAIRLRLVQ